MEVFLLFVLYSFLGCVLENIYYFVLHGKYISKRTLLSLPLCPVYGISALVLSAVNTSDSILVLFLNGFFVVSSIELAFFLISQRLYSIKWWDYSHMRFNIFGGISLFYSLLWGILNIIFAKYLHPFILFFLSTFSQNAKLFTGVFLFIYILRDVKNTHAELLKLKYGEKNTIFDKFLYINSNN